MTIVKSIVEQHDRDATAENEDGPGLLIAEQHGGNVTVENEVGKGSCFALSLPLTQIETA